MLSFSNSFGGKWKNADGISVQILDKVKSLVDKEDFRLSMDGIVSQIESWNDVADGVSFGDIEVSDTDEDLGMDIRMTCGSIITPGGYQALGYAMTMDENGQVLEGDDDSMNGNWGDSIVRCNRFLKLQRHSKLQLCNPGPDNYPRIWSCAWSKTSVLYGDSRHAANYSYGRLRHPRPRHRVSSGDL